MGWQGGCLSVQGGGSEEDLTTIAEIEAALDARGLTLARLNAILRIADGSSSVMATSNATFAHQNNTNEQDVIEIVNGVLPEKVDLDCNALTQVTTFRFYEKVDGANYRLYNAVVYPTDVPTNVKVVPFEWSPKGRDVKITAQSSVVEGAIRNIPYARRTGT